MNTPRLIPFIPREKPTFIPLNGIQHLMLINQRLMKLLLVSILFVLGTADLLKAQQNLPTREIIVNELWDTNQTLTSSIVVKSGATLYIGGSFANPTNPTFPPSQGAQNIIVAFEFVDVNNDGVGDIGITVEPGGALVINTTGTVDFQKTGTNTGGDDRHWNGLTFESNLNVLSLRTTIRNAFNALTLSVADTLANLNLNGNANGLVLNEPNTIIGGGSITNSSSGAAVTINGDNIGLYSMDFVSADTAIKVVGNNATIKYVDIDTATSVGLWLAGNNATIDWVTIQDAAKAVQVAGTGTSISNSDFYQGNLGIQVDSAASLTIRNTEIMNNTLDGIVSAGSVDADAITVSNNGGDGIEITQGSFIMVNSSDSANVGTGIRIDSASTLRFNRNNLSDNDASGNDLQVIHLDSLRADFNNNWWGVGTRVDTMFSSTFDDMIDYTTFRRNGAFLFNGADLAVTESLTYNNFADGDYTIGNKYQLTYSTTGNVPFLRLTAAAAEIDPNPVTTPNFGFVDITIGAAAAPGNVTTTFSTTGVTYGGFSNAVVTSVDPELSAIFVTNANTSDFGGTNIDDAWLAGSTVRVQWSAPSSISLVNISYADNQSPTPNVVTVAENVDATIGFIDFTVPNTTLNEDGIVGTGTTGQVTITVENANGTGTPGTLIIDGIVAKPTATWDFTPTDANMTVHFRDLDFSDDIGEDYGPSLYKPADGEVIYLGAFYTDSDNNLKNAGYTLLDPTKPAGLPTTINKFDNAADDATNAADTGGEDVANITEIYDADGAGVIVAVNAPEPITVTVYGDDLNTPAKDGFRSGSDNIRWFIYRESWGSHSQSETSTVDNTSREVGAFDIDESNANADGVRTIQYVTNTLSDGSGADGAAADPAQIIFYDDAFTFNAGNYTAQVDEFAFTRQNLDTEGPVTTYTPLTGGGWFWISTYLDHNGGGNANTLGYDAAANAGAILDIATDVDAAAGIGGVSRKDATPTLGAFQLGVGPGAGGALTSANAFTTTNDAGTLNNATNAAEAGWFYYNSATGLFALTPYVNAGSANNTFTMMKNGLGEVYWNIDKTDAVFGATDIATGEFNVTPPVWDVTKGYIIRIEGPGAAANDINFLRFTGTKVTPTTPITLNTGWNLVPNLRGGQNVDTFDDVNQLNIASAMGSIADPNIIVKDVYGDIYWPAFGINTIGSMREMHAYYVYVSTPDVLRYPADSFTAKETLKRGETKVANTHFVVDFNSDNSAIVLIEASKLTQLAEGTEVGFFNSRGDLVGATVYTGSNIAATLWGQSSMKEENEKGLLPGEAFTIKAFDPSTNETMVLKDLSFSKGSGVYQHNGIEMISGAQLVNESELPTEFALEQNYPNPFNPSTTIRFSLADAATVQLEVFNIAGQRVASIINGNEMAAGIHAVSFDASSLASGVYLYRIQAGSFVATRKMNLIR